MPQPRASHDRTPRRDRSVSATRLLASREIPLPPLPDVSLGLVGGDVSTALSIAAMSSLPVCALDSTDCAPPVGALLLDVDGDPTLVAALAARRDAGDHIPAVAFGTARDSSHDALRAEVFFVRGALDADDLAHVAWRAQRYAITSAAHRTVWGRTRLAPWIAQTLGACDLTDRRAEIVAHAALGRRREGIAEDMGISLGRVDEQIGHVLKQTKQQRLIDVANPFTARIAALGTAPSPTLRVV